MAYPFDTFNFNVKNRQCNTAPKIHPCTAFSRYLIYYYRIVFILQQKRFLKWWQKHIQKKKHIPSVCVLKMGNMTNALNNLRCLKTTLKNHTFLFNCHFNNDSQQHCSHSSSTPTISVMNSITRSSKISTDSV